MKFRSYFCVLLAALLFAYPAANAAIGNGDKTTLRIGITQEFDSLNPLHARMLVSRYVYNMINRTLVTLDKDARWVPMVAKSIPTLENGEAKVIKEGGKEKIVANWEIRENYTWGDGTPVTAKDVKFSWEVAQAKFSGVNDRDVYAQVEEIKIDPKNPRKFTFKYREAAYNYYHIGNFALLPEHIERPIFKKYGSKKEGYIKNSEYAKNPTNPGLYMGPYVISQLKLGSHVVLTKNPKFTVKPAKIEKIVLKLIPNTNTLESNLRSGTIDMISTFGFTLDQALAFEKKSKQNNWAYNIDFQESITYEHIDLNMDNPKLKDIRVRKALVYAINRKELTTALFEGRQKPAVHNVSPVDPWFTDDPNEIVVYDPSKRKARKLLTDAGWKLNKEDGYRYKNGERLTFTLMTTAGNKTRELVQVFLKNEWKKVGVDIKIKNEPARVYFGETVRKGTFDSMAMYAWTSSPEWNPARLLHSRNIPRSDNGYAGNNAGKWVDPAVDKALDDLNAEFDVNKRKAIMAKVLRAYTDQVPVIPLYYRSNVSVKPKNMKGHFVSSHQFPGTNYVENWEIL